MEKVHANIPIKIIMKVNGKKIKEMGKEFINLKMEIFIKENG